MFHPDDMGIATEMIPSDRVFRRIRFDDVFYHYQYGPDVLFRVRPCMWLKLDWEGIDVGDQVEVSGLGMVRQPMVARVSEMRFKKRSRTIEYTLDNAGVIQPRTYQVHELIQLTEKHKLRQR